MHTGESMLKGGGMGFRLERDKVNVVGCRDAREIK